MGEDTYPSSATINLLGGTLQLQSVLSSGTNANIHVEGGTFIWAGDKTAQIDGLVADGTLTWTDGQTMLTDFWESSWTNGSSVLYADYNDVNAGATTVWAKRPGGYLSWSNSYGLVEGDFGDDDSDGLVNLKEYAFGGDPTNGFVDAYLPQYIKSGSGFNYVYTQRTDDPKLTYTLELTGDLIAGPWANSGFTVTGTNPIADPFEEVTNSIPTTDLEKFIRLTIGR
jgi:hypothetical protein